VITDPGFYFAAVPATLLMGLSKGGFTGLSVLAQPVLALAISPIQAAAIMLPVLIVQDVVSIAAYWRRWDGGELLRMLPAAVVGIVIGYLMVASVSDAAVQLGIGILSLVEAGRRLMVLLRDRMGRPGKSAGAAAAASPPQAMGHLGAVFWSVIAGFTSMIANAGGPPIMIYLLRRPHLSPERFAATSSAFFAVVNWVKVPFFLALGQINGANMGTSAVLFPLAVLATLAGVWLVRIVPAERFFGLIYALLAAVGVKLVFDGLMGL